MATKQEMTANLEQLLGLQDKLNDLKASWCRQMVTLASGGLAVLVGLNPETQSEGIAKWFLAATWLFLGSGIVSGASTLYLDVSGAQALKDAYKSEFEKSIKSGKEMNPVVANPAPFFIRSRRIMIFSLLLAVVNLVIYAIVTTL